MAFESCVVPEDWRFALIVPLYKGKWERTECKNYRGASQLSIFVGKIYSEILVDKLIRVTEDFIEDEQGGFRSGKVFVDQIFSLKQISMRENMKDVWVFYGFGEGV